MVITELSPEIRTSRENYEDYKLDTSVLIDVSDIYIYIYMIGTLYSYENTGNEKNDNS